MTKKLSVSQVIRDSIQIPFSMSLKAHAVLWLSLLTIISIIALSAFATFLIAKDTMLELFVKSTITNPFTAIIAAIAIVALLCICLVSSFYFSLTLMRLSLALLHQQEFKVTHLAWDLKGLGSLVAIFLLVSPISVIIFLLINIAHLVLPTFIYALFYSVLYLFYFGITYRLIPILFCVFAEKRMGIFEVLEFSWRITKDNTLRILGSLLLAAFGVVLGLVVLGISLGALLLFFTKAASPVARIGIIITTSLLFTPYASLIMATAMASIYTQLTKQD